MNGFFRNVMGLLKSAIGASLIGFMQAGAGAVLRFIQDVLRERVSVKDFGAIGDGVANDSPAIAAAIAFAGNNSKVFFPPGGNYRITEEITLPPTSFNITLSGYGANLTVAGTHNGINLTAQNENYGWHTVEGLTITGPNNYYAGTMTATTASGILIQDVAAPTSAAFFGYNTVIRDVTLEKFKYGLRAKNAIKVRVEGKTFIRFNRYGVYLDGGITNANNFDGCIITYNDTAGLYSSGSATSIAEATSNVFDGCLFESNHAYGATGGTAIYLNNSFDFVFENCYTEDHQYAVVLTNGAKGNRFNSFRFAPGPAGKDAVLISGANSWNNVFWNCKSSVVNATDVNVEVDNAGQRYNQFIDCEGFNFIAGSIAKMPYVRNMRPNLNFPTVRGYGYIGMPEQGYYENAGSGTAAGLMTGIGTNAATLNCEGLGEISLSTLVAAAGADTTITTLSNLRLGQIITIWNYQNTRKVTLDGSGGTGNIVGLDGEDIVFTDYGQSVTLYVNGFGRAYEIGRNFVETGSVTLNFKNSSDVAVGGQTTTAKYRKIGKSVFLEFASIFTSTTDVYYTSDIPWTSAVVPQCVGGVKSGSVFYPAESISANRLRVYVTATTNGFTGYATINLA